MNSKRLSVCTTAVTILLVLAVFVVFFAVLDAANKDSLDSMTCILAIAFSLTDLFAIYYILAGCKKDGGARYFTWFMNAFAFCQILLLFKVEEMTALFVIAIAVCFGALCVLSMAKDLGQKKSTALALVVLILSAARLVAGLVSGMFSAGYPFSIYNLVFAINTLFMISAKYYDKASRGSK